MIECTPWNGDWTGCNFWIATSHALRILWWHTQVTEGRCWVVLQACPMHYGPWLPNISTRGNVHHGWPSLLSQFLEIHHCCHWADWETLTDLIPGLQDHCARHVFTYNSNFGEGFHLVQVKINPGAFKGLSSDVEFASLLAEEESVLVLPGNNLLMIGLWPCICIL